MMIPFRLPGRLVHLRASAVSSMAFAAACASDETLSTSPSDQPSLSRDGSDQAFDAIPGQAKICAFNGIGTFEVTANGAPVQAEKPFTVGGDGNDCQTVYSGGDADVGVTLKAANGKLDSIVVLYSDDSENESMHPPPATVQREVSGQHGVSLWYKFDRSEQDSMPPSDSTGEGADSTAPAGAGPTTPPASDSSAPTVSTPALATAAGSVECGAPRAGWLWCDDFEQDRLASYFEYDKANGNFVRSAGVGNKASFGMRARYIAGQSSAGSLHLAVGRTPQSYFRPVDGGTARYRELYWRIYVRNAPGWVASSGGDKLSRAFSFISSSSWAQSMIAHLWGGTGRDRNYLIVDPVSGTSSSGRVLTTDYNDFAHFTWLGLARGKVPIFDQAHVGRWYCVEAHARLNDPGQSNGLVEYWLNGEPQAARTGLDYVGTYDGYGLNAIYFENYMNAGSPRNQDRFFDNIVVSTQRIGC